MNNNRTKLAKAVAMTLAGAALSAGAVSNASAHVMYNTFTTTASTQTDGWTRVYDGNADTIATGPESQGNKGDLVPWVGTAGGALPFGYIGSSHLNWAAQLHSVGASLEVSQADAIADYGFAAEIDTGGGAWRDNSATPTGWKHQTDIGLIKSDVTQFVTLNATALGAQTPTFAKFGVTIFEGMDTNTGNYSHHGSWNNPSVGKPYTMDNPFGTTGLTNIGYSDNVDAITGYTFLAQAGQVYSIYLGGVDFSKWNTGVDNYKLNITTSAVPVPAAVWLFGSALAGMGIIGRRKDKAAAAA